jgi:hypothetical protein
MAHVRRLLAITLMQRMDDGDMRRDDRQISVMLLSVADGVSDGAEEAIREAKERELQLGISSMDVDKSTILART